MTQDLAITPYVRPAPKPSTVANVRLDVALLNAVHELCAEKGERKSDILRQAIACGLPLLQQGGRSLCDAAPAMLAALKIVQAQTSSEIGRGVVQGPDMKAVWDAIAQAEGDRGA